MNMLLIAALLCPTAPQVKGLEVFELVAECPMPLATGWVLTPKAYTKNAARIAGLDSRLGKKIDRLKKCRVVRDDLSKTGLISAKANLALTNRMLEQVKAGKAPPSRAAWASVGALAMFAVIGTGALIYAASQDDN